MKTKDLLKYFLGQSYLFTVEDSKECGLSSIDQVVNTFNCGSDDIFESRSIIPGDYLVTYKPNGLKPSFIVVEDVVIRYFTLIEEE